MAARKNTSSDAKKELMAQSYLEDARSARAGATEAVKWLANTLLILNGGGLLYCVERLDEDPSAMGPAKMFSLGLGVLLSAGVAAIGYSRVAELKASYKSRGIDVKVSLWAGFFRYTMIGLLAISMFVFINAMGDLKDSIQESVEAKQMAAERRGQGQGTLPEGKKAGPSVGVLEH